jgi:hypothetical protein
MNSDVRLRFYGPYGVQSAGGDWMPHTLPGSASTNPNSHCFSYCPIEMQFTTRAVTLAPVGRLSKRTVVPISRGRQNRAAHPCGFTRIIKHGSDNA